MAEWIAATATLAGARPLDDVAVLGVHRLPGDTAASQALADAGLPWVDAPGTLAGRGPVVSWRTPRERVVLGQGAEQRQAVQAVQHALAAGRHAGAIAVDLSAAKAVVELHGPGLDDWLARLVDASAVPREPGRVSGCRLADVPALLLRLDPGRLWLVVDRALRPYVTEWLAYTHAAVAADHDRGRAR